MSMIKLIQPRAQEFSEPVAAAIKLSSRGIIGADKAAFVKRAGAEFAEKASSLTFAPGEVPVHLIAIGATEDYGPNRNGDGFCRETCKKHHTTFEKYARFYRDHANKNPAKSFGIVKASFYNEPMRRIELICALNSTKEAADRNGGLLADREMDKLLSGKDIPVSMACKIPFDKCSACGNKARTRAEYCDDVSNGGFCKAGGLKHNLGRVLSDGHVLHADNPDPSFFDISHVFRPADRIAYVFGELQKAASNTIISGAELAEQMELTFPFNYLYAGKSVQSQLGALAKLAAAERNLEETDTDLKLVALASHPAVQQEIEGIDCSSAKMASVFRGLSDAGVMLSLKDFLTLTIKSANDALLHAVSAALPGIFSELEKQADIVDDLEGNIFYPANHAPLATHVWAEKVAASRSFLPKEIEKRARLAAVRGATADISLQKLGSANEQSGTPEKALAKYYALYKIATFASVNEKYPENLLTPAYCVLQNYIT